MMNLKGTFHTTLALALCASLSACATGIAHENFKKVMGRQIGKSADDPGAYLVYYRERRVGATVLPNGNIEEQYRAGRDPCRVYFQVDKASRKIVGWRYEGTEEAHTSGSGLAIQHYSSSESSCSPTILLTVE